jgi:hypothetical protein
MHCVRYCGVGLRFSQLEVLPDPCRFRSDRSGQPTVDPHVLPRYVAGVVREEERHSLRDLSDRPSSLHRYGAPGLVVYLEALDEPREDVVHPDTFGRVTVGVEFGEAGQGGAQGGREGKMEEGSKAENVETLTMAPPPCRSITGVTNRAMRTTFSTTRP